MIYLHWNWVEIICSNGSSSLLVFCLYSTSSYQWRVSYPSCRCDRIRRGTGKSNLKYHNSLYMRTGKIIWGNSLNASEQIIHNSDVQFGRKRPKHYFWAKLNNFGPKMVQKWPIFCQDLNCRYLFLNNKFKSHNKNPKKNGSAKIGQISQKPYNVTTGYVFLTQKWPK